MLPRRPFGKPIVVAAAVAVAAAAWPALAGAQSAAATPQISQPSERGALGVEFTASALGEAWNLNNTHETLVGGSAGVWWTFANRTSLLVEFDAIRVFQESSRHAFVQGMTTMLRWHAVVGEGWTWFVDVGPGISWSDTRTPPRGTAFNYLAAANTGVLARVTEQSRVIVGFRWLHLSNSGREGRDRNPDIEALGAFVGVSVAF